MLILKIDFLFHFILLWFSQAVKLHNESTTYILRPHNISCLVPLLEKTPWEIRQGSVTVVNFFCWNYENKKQGFQTTTCSLKHLIIKIEKIQIVSWIVKTTQATKLETVSGTKFYGPYVVFPTNLNFNHKMSLVGFSKFTILFLFTVNVVSK